MAEIRVKQPDRNTMRFVFETALKGAEMPGGRATITQAYLWHELSWEAADKVAAAAKEQEGQREPSGQAANSQQPAVVEHGINSPEAQAMRDARKAMRLEDERKRRAGKAKGKAPAKVEQSPAPVGEANTEPAAKEDEGTLPA